MEMSVDPLEIPLPQVRPDLVFHDAPNDHDGSPTLNVMDPLTGQFVKLGWSETAILRRLRTRKTIGQLVTELRRETTLDPSPEEILRFIGEAQFANLTVQSSIRDPAILSAEAAARKVQPLKWLLHHYLYFRIPLLHPDRFLAATLPLVRLLVSWLALFLYALVALGGAYFLSQYYARFLRTFNNFFTPRGMLYFVVTMVLVKVIHEFSHAYTAKALNVRVPVMGVAFMVMWPVAFCDVTEGWKLKKRRDRLKISTAGILAELVLTAFSLCLWGLTTPGIIQSLCFWIATVTIISTLLVNLNPAMRFDGYYILSDLWGIDNMRQRCFAMARWGLHRLLLGVTMPPPEDGVSRRRLIGMMIYSLYAWGYRILLYLGIAVLVYYKFTKVLGVFLFGVEVSWFMVRPVVNEIKILYKMRDFIRLNFRLVLLLCSLLGGGLWLALPLPRTIAIPAVVIAEDHAQTIYAPISGKVLRLKVGRDAIVKKGQALFTIHTDRITDEIKIAKKEIEILKIELDLLTFDPKGRNQLPEKRGALQQAQQRLDALQRQDERNTVRAKISGTVYEWDRTVREGLPVQRDQVLGQIADLRENRIVAFLHEDYVNSVKTGSRIEYRSRGKLKKWRGKIVAINPVREEFAKHPALASLAHGDLPVLKNAEGKMILQETYYKVDIILDQGHPPLLIGNTGKAYVHTERRSRLVDGARQVWRVILRESGF